MADAERIAEYLNAQECGNPWTVNDVELRIADPSTQCHDLARMLSDVRREERERIAAALHADAHHIQDSCDVEAIVIDIRAGTYAT